MDRAAGSRLSRRQLVQGMGVMGLALLAGCGRLPWQAQQPARVPHIGYLASASPGEPNGEAFMEGLHELGYAEDQNIRIEWRFAEERDELLPQLVAELIGLP